MYIENVFIAEAPFLKQNINKRHLLWHYSSFR